MVFFNERFTAARHEEACYKKKLYNFELRSCLQRTIGLPRTGGKGHRISGDIRPGVGFKTDGFVEEKLRGLPSNDPATFADDEFTVELQRKHQQDTRSKTRTARTARSHHDKDTFAKVCYRCTLAPKGVECFHSSTPLVPTAVATETTRQVQPPHLHLKSCSLHK